MKKFLFCICIVLLLSSSECETGNKVSSTESYDLFIDTVNGHEYIIMRAMYSGNIIHSESCQCKKGGSNENN